MKNTSKINLDEIRDSRLRDVLLVVNECCLKLGIDFYILGALAKDIWFTKHGIPASGTKDVDFAVLLSETEQFYQIKETLIDEHKYAQGKDNEYVLTAPNGFQIDILPFGAIEVDNGVIVKGEGLKKIKVNGFKEVYLTSVRQVFVLKDKQFNVATLPGIFLLKLIAYDDRPEHRQNDPIDCINIIKNYFNIESDLIWDKHNDLFGDDRSLEVIASRVIGREMGKPLGQDSKLKERTLAILRSHISLEEKSSFILKMASYTYMGTEECTLYLSEILAGIMENDSKSATANNYV
jgi:predicted nucleotidyltransferase